MTCPAVRLPKQTKSDHRRPGIFPGRRFALAAVVACAAARRRALPATAAAEPDGRQRDDLPGHGGERLQPAGDALDPEHLRSVPGSELDRAAAEPEPASDLAAGVDARDGPDLRAPDTERRCERSAGGQVHRRLRDAALQRPDLRHRSIPRHRWCAADDLRRRQRGPDDVRSAAAEPDRRERRRQRHPTGRAGLAVVYENQPPLAVTPTQSPVAGSQGRRRSRSRSARPSRRRTGPRSRARR